MTMKPAPTLVTVQIHTYPLQKGIAQEILGFLHLHHRLFMDISLSLSHSLSLSLSRFTLWTQYYWVTLLKQWNYMLWCHRLL